MYIAMGQGQKTPWEQTFDVNRKPLSSRGRQTFVDKILMSTEKPRHFAHLLQVSKKCL